MTEICTDRGVNGFWGREMARRSSTPTHRPNPL